MASSLKQRLEDDVLIFDGAVGTELYKHNFFINVCFDELCLSSAQVVGEIHAAYAEAGADVITTNSFGANRNKLARYGLAEKIAEINRAAVDVARANTSEQQRIAGSVGPIGDIPYNSGVSDDDIVSMLAEQVGYLADAGADFILFETLPSRRDLRFALRAMERHATVPFMLSMAVNREAETGKGESFKSILADIAASPRNPDALGLNCQVGPEGMLTALERVMELCHLPVVAQPNAGLPHKIDNRTIYMTSPEYFTTYGVRYINLGARGVGGCCGTGPDHVRDLARSVRPLAKKRFAFEARAQVREEDYQEPVPTAEKSKLGAKLAAGEWVTTVEIVPPRGFSLESTVAKAARCREAGVDAINIPDGPRASSRMSPIITSMQIQDKAGIEAILHFCCRDRNLIGMQSDLLGCAAAGIHNLLFVTGDPPKLGDYPFASAVFDADSIGMARVQASLNRGVDLGGKAMVHKTAAFIGVGADPNAIDFQREIRRIREKAEAGAEFIITQPVFAVEPLFKFLESVADLNIPVIAGIWPLASYRNAEFMRNEVPGVVVPDQIMERMAKGKTKEEQRAEGIAIARESVEAIRSSVQGVQVSAPFGNVDTAIAALRPNP